MSSPYPILDNRPIDKWKVTELKEELKRRKLTTRGLKEELVRRLDEALRMERENAEASEGAAEEGDQDENTTPVTEKATPLIGEATLVGGKATPVTGEDTPFRAKSAPLFGEDAMVGGKATPVATQEKVAPTGTTPVEAKEAPSVAVEASASADETTPVLVETMRAAVETTPVHVKWEDSSVKNADDKDEKVDDVRNRASVDNYVVDLKLDKDQEGYVKDETAKSEPGVESSNSLVAEEALSEHVHKSDVEIEKKEPETRLDGEDFNYQPENEGIRQPENEGIKAQPVDGSASNNQVSEISLVSGFEVKSDCISTDSVSNNENKLKDNVIADNVKLEYNVTKSEEMVEPSSVGGESHPMDVEEPLEQKTSVGDRDHSTAANADMTKANDNIDAGDSEKLNLDRSSGDDSMEEDVDAKQTESNNSEDFVNRSEKNEMRTDKVETPIDTVGKDAVAGKGDLPESKIPQVMTSEKRKLPANDQEGVGNNEPVKKQRRWNSENIKVPEAHTYNSAPTITPKSTGLNRNFSRTDSSASEDGPKERIVPPSQKDPTNSLRIDRFLRPFTLKAVQELLGKSGTVTSFWMDHIKTHCYVSYSSVEEAVETRNAVYNLQWPPNGGRLLIAEFVDPEEVKAKLETPLAPTMPAAAPSQPTSEPQPPLHPHGSQAPQQQQHALPTALPPPPPPVSYPPPVKERLPPPPPVPEQQEPPIVTLDDLFRKTKATPRIYYLPLSDEQVAAKLAARGKSIKK